MLDDQFPSMDELLSIMSHQYRYMARQLRYTTRTSTKVRGTNLDFWKFFENLHTRLKVVKCFPLSQHPIILVILMWKTVTERHTWHDSHSNNGPLACVWLANSGYRSKYRNTSSEQSRCMSGSWALLVQPAFNQASTVYRETLKDKTQSKQWLQFSQGQQQSSSINSHIYKPVLILSNKTRMKNVWLPFFTTKWIEMK